jgi:toxin ParE1/3/4
VTPRYKIAESAANDLKEIWHYTADRYGEAQANQYLAALKAGCEKIAEAPDRWRTLTLAGFEVRFYRCEHHYIVYATTGIKGAKVAILAFLHERMDLMARLEDRLT